MSSTVTKESIKPIKAEEVKKDTPIGLWRKDMPKGQKVVASSNGVQTMKDAKTTESQTTGTSATQCVAFHSQECCQARS